MPCWTIHLGVASKLNEDFHLNKDLYLYGSVLPDVSKNNSFGRDYSHYYGEMMHSKCKNEPIIELDRFIKDYKDKLDEDIILGYYTHLLTDYYFNDYIYSNCFVTNDKGNAYGVKLKSGTIYVTEEYDHDTRRNLKQDDFLNYGKFLFDNNLFDIPKDKEIIYKYLSLLKNDFISREEVNFKLDYFNSYLFNLYNSGFREDNLYLLSKDSYDELFDGCVTFIKKKIK